MVRNAIAVKAAKKVFNWTTRITSLSKKSILAKFSYFVKKVLFLKPILLLKYKLHRATTLNEQHNIYHMSSLFFSSILAVLIEIASRNLLFRQAQRLE